MRPRNFAALVCAVAEMIARRHLQPRVLFVKDSDVKHLKLCAGYQEMNAQVPGLMGEREVGYIRFNIPYAVAIAVGSCPYVPRGHVANCVRDELIELEPWPNSPPNLAKRVYPWLPPPPSIPDGVKELLRLGVDGPALAPFRSLNLKKAVALGLVERLEPQGWYRTNTKGMHLVQQWPSIWARLRDESV